MVNKLAQGAIKRKSKLTPKPPMSKPSFPRPMAATDGPDMEYRAREAMADIVRAEQHKKNPKLMKAVQQHLAAVTEAVGGGLRSGKKKR